MNTETIKNNLKLRRRLKIRAKVSGTAKCPRLSVFKSNKGMYLQLIDDESGKTLVSAYTKEVNNIKNKTDLAAALGKLIAEKALAKNIKKVVFDRGGNLYAGRVKAVADSARAAGLEF
jgi:large subunit ribosomal protein L18